MEITKATISCAYDLLRSIKPFSEWELPDDIECVVTDDLKAYGEFEPPNIIRISNLVCYDMDTFIRTMAHEMLHLHQSCSGLRVYHGKKFHELVKQVCESTGLKEI